MIYVINFLAAAAVPLAVAAYGGHLAAKVLDKPERRRALSVVWALAVAGVFLSGVQQVFVYRSRQAEDIQRAALGARDIKDQKQLQEKLDSSLQREDYLTNELDSIARYLRAPHPGMSMNGVTATASRMADDAMQRHARRGQ